MKVWNSCLKAILLVFGLVLLMPQPGNAIPAFARKYGVRCYTCHTVPPALNKNGYMFKRLGYRMPPDEMDGSKPAPKITALDKNIKFDLINTFAILLQASATEDKNIAETGTTPPATDTSAFSFNLDEAALFVAGPVPETGFSYFVHYEMYQDGSNGLEQGFGQWHGGRANSSYFLKAGQMHMQEGEGTRAAMFYNLFPDPAYFLTNTDPNGVTLDQAPVGVDGGYTWASNYFKNIFAVSAKVTNGLDANGNAILNASTKNAKDFWVDGDYWFGPDGGVTAMYYHGSKDQVQNAGAENEFTYTPSFDRVGAMGNYLFFDKLDVLGGYIHGRDDWQWDQGDTGQNYTSNTYHVEGDYYIKTGTAFMARLDRGTQKITLQPTMHTRAWGVGVEHAMTQMGNVILRASYNEEHDGDPVALLGTTDKLFKLDLRFAW
ncbi:hypothetical protein P8935_17475 [Telmatobacter sp. DSM 110680]|uniref:Cytochrome c domain-containing protein n=1 Tax=Telmatobacter sp. DSM 110680 TaxID=3036704 RepID=A0AAU7DGT4_9BACT